MCVSCLRQVAVLFTVHTGSSLCSLVWNMQLTAVVIASLLCCRRRETIHLSSSVCCTHEHPAPTNNPLSVSSHHAPPGPWHSCTNSPAWSQLISFHKRDHVQLTLCTWTTNFYPCCCNYQNFIPLSLNIWIFHWVTFSLSIRQFVDTTAHAKPCLLWILLL